MSKQPSGLPILSSIAALAANSEAWLVDIWGVMHNGVSPFVSAGEACRTFRAHGGTVLLLSNSPRPADSVAEQLARIGVDPRAYDSILTSGDATRALIAPWQGRPLLHIGPERDMPLFAGLDVTFAAPVEAEIAVATGLYDDDTETADDYRELLATLKARDVEMICANPDVTVERGDRLVYCAGAIARAYAAIGGRVAYAGKPYSPIYELALQRIAALRGAPVGTSRLLAIGDGLETDIAGAAAAGIASLFIASGVSLGAGQTLTPAALDALFADRPIKPLGAMPALAWV